MSVTVVLAVLAALAGQPQDNLPQGQIVTTSGPIVTADPWVQSVSGTCHGDVLEITGYGVRRPLGQRADIRFNGQAVVGEGIERLRGDLSVANAVYRLQLICNRAGFMVIVARGESKPDDVVTYVSGPARWSGERLESYEGLEPAEASDFWF